MFKNQKSEDLEKEIIRKIYRREKKKKPKMKVSGRKVLELKKIISKKSNT